MKFSIKLLLAVITLFITRDALGSSPNDALEAIVCHECNQAGEIETTRRRAAEAAQFHYPTPASGQIVTVILGIGVLRLEALPNGNWQYGGISSGGIRNHHDSNIYQSDCGPSNSYCDAVDLDGIDI